ncbi:MAG: transcriptional regulator NrdR [Nanoarchaeota archaeon]
MRCPYCQKEDTKVVDKRDFGDITKRRRECLSCERRFNTLENVESARLRIIKKDGRREEFDRDKVKKGIERACEKRPISDEQIEKMVLVIEDKLRKKGKEVPANYVGEVVSKELKKADEVAYIRFASVYRNFKELSDFKKEIKQLTK